MENNVDRYAEVIKDLLFIANARIEVKAATNRLKKNLTVHELSTKPCCNRSDARYALKKLLNDDLIGEIGLTERGLPNPHGKMHTKVHYKDLVLFVNDARMEDGAAMIAALIKLVGTNTIMKEELL